MVALSDNASLLVMGGSDYGSVTQLWDVEAQVPVAGALGESRYAEGVALTADGSLAAVSFRGGISVWETQPNSLRYRLPGTADGCAGCAAGSVAFSADGSQLAVFSGGGRPDNEVSVFYTATGERTLVLPGPGRGYDDAEVRFSPDGRRLALVSQNNEPYASGTWRQLSRTTLWDLPEGRLVGSYVQDTQTNGQADAHAWRGGSPVVGVAYRDRLELVEVVTGVVLSALPLDRSGVIPEMLYLSPDGRYAALKYRFEDRESGAPQRGNELVVWDVPSARSLYRETALLPLGFSADSRYLLTHSKAGVALRNPATLKADKVLVNGAVLPLRIESEPTYIDQTRYAVAGTAKLGDAPPVSFGGEANGGDTQLYVLISPTLPPTLELQFPYQDELWRLGAGPSSERTNSPVSWVGSLEAVASDTPRRPYSVELEPVN